jgi:hypothetical protein
LTRPPIRAATSTKEEAMGTWTQMEAERAFERAARGRRLAALIGRVKRGGLAVYDETRRSASGARRGVREIPLDAVRGTT